MVKLIQANQTHLQQGYLSGLKPGSKWYHSSHLPTLK